MGNCARIKTRPAKSCIGDMKAYISIYKKTKQAVNTTAVDPNLNLSLVASMWAMQKSVNGEEIFDGVNMIGKITDHFFIRYDSIVVNKTHLLEYDGNRYEIVEVIPNYEGKRELILLKCSIRGDSTLTNTKI
jgi:SPP1 family predicted phage head-tail adaptor